MKFKSPAVERSMTRLSQSIAGGFFIPILLLLGITQGESGEAGRSLLETHPFVYILAWPLTLWKYFLLPFEAYLATAVSNIIIYSLLTYRFIRLLSNPKRFP